MHTWVFICYTALVTYLSLRPSGVGGIEHLDKLAHLLVYYVFAVFGYRVLHGGRHYLPVCLGIIAYGVLLEWVQSFTPDRLMSGYDMLANTLGVGLGALVMVNRRR